MKARGRLSLPFHLTTAAFHPEGDFPADKFPSVKRERESGGREKESKRVRQIERKQERTREREGVIIYRGRRFRAVRRCDRAVLPLTLSTRSALSFHRDLSIFSPFVLSPPCGFVRNLYTRWGRERKKEGLSIKRRALPKEPRMRENFRPLRR